jgi:hypothetical protein
MKDPGWELNGGEVVAAVKRVRDEVAISGYAWMRSAVTYEFFEEVCGLLGSITLRTDVRIDEERNDAQRKVRIDKDRPSVYQSSALDFHTDSHTVDLIGWYCRDRDETGGASLLVDTSDLAELFSEEELEALTEVKVRYPGRSPAGVEEVVETPMLKRRGETFSVAYAPWLVETPSKPEAKTALARFERYVADKRRTSLISVTLKPGESLFIDNSRMLHARDELPSDSKRHLIRLYLREHH